MKNEMINNLIEEIDDVDNEKELLEKVLIFLGGCLFFDWIGKGVSNIMELKRREKTI